jgi:outer membrane protein TolC
MIKNWRFNIFFARKIGLGLIARLVLVFSCYVAVGPDYVRPEVSIPKEWSAGVGGGKISGQQDARTLATWWSTLNDAELLSLIERAVQKNLDLREAKSYDSWIDG